MGNQRKNGHKIRVNKTSSALQSTHGYQQRVKIHDKYAEIRRKIAQHE